MVKKEMGRGYGEERKTTGGSVRKVKYRPNETWLDAANYSLPERSKL